MKPSVRITFLTAALAATLARADDPTAATFAAPHKMNAGAKPVGLVLADLDGDGAPDVVTADSAAAPPVDVIVRRNDGTGTTFFASSFQVSGVVEDVAAGDFDKDGKIDLVVVSGGGLVVEKNRGNDSNGDPTFSPAVTLTSGAAWPIRSVAAADVDHDGFLDLVVSGYSVDDFGQPAAGGVAVFRNDGAGSFGAPSVQSTHDGPGRVATADLDGDGRADVVVPHQYSNGVSVLLAKQDASATLESPTFWALDHAPTGVALADVTGDGKPDFVTSGFQYDFGTGDNHTSVIVTRNVADGAGRFGSFGTTAKIGVATLSGLGPTAIPSDVVVADVNGDGKPEIVVADYVRAAATAIYFDAVQSGGAFDHVQALFQQSSASGASPTRIAAANLNPGTGTGLDALADVVTANWNSGGVNVLLNTSAGDGGGGTGPAALTVTGEAHSHAHFPPSSTVDFTHAYDKVTYEIDFKNTGGATAKKVLVKAKVPSGTLLFPQDGDNYKKSGSTLSWSVGDLPGGGQGSVYFTVLVKPTVKLQDPVKLTTFTAQASGLKPVAGTQVVLYVANPLSLDVQHAPPEVKPGDALTYTLVFTNQAAYDSDEVEIADPLPEGTRYTGAFFLDANGTETASPIANPNGGLNPALSSDGRTVHWYLGSVPAGETRKLKLVTQVQFDRVLGGSLYDDGSAVKVQAVLPLGLHSVVFAPGHESSHVAVSEQGAANAPSLVLWPIVDADGSVTLPNGDEQPTVQAGSTFTCVYYCANDGGSNANGLRFQEYLPRGTTFVAGSFRVDGTTFPTIAPATSKTDSYFDVDLAAAQHGVLSPRASMIVRFDVSVPASAKTGTLLPHGGPSGWHPRLASSDLGEPVEGQPLPDVKVVAPVTFDFLVTTPDAPPRGIRPGTDIAYQIRYHNDGGVAATNVVISETMPAGTTFKSARTVEGPAAVLFPAEPGFSTKKVQWTIPTVPADGSGTVELVVTLTSPIDKSLAKLTSFIHDEASIAGRFVKQRSTVKRDGARRFVVKDGTAGTVAAPTQSAGTDNRVVTDDRAILCVARIAQQEATKDGEITYLIGYGNLSDVAANDVQVAMLVPNETTCVLNSISGGGRLLGSKASKGLGTVTWNLGTLAAHSGGALQFTVHVAGNFSKCAATDNSCYVKASNCPTTAAGPISTNVRSANFVVHQFESLGCFLDNVGARLSGQRNDALDADMARAGANSFAGGLCVGDALGVDGSYVVPLGDGNVLAFGRAGIVASGAGNIVASGAGNIVASGAGNMTVGGSAASSLLANAASIVASGGGNIFANGGENLVGHDASMHAFLVDNATNSLIASAPIVASGAGNLIPVGGANIVASGAGNIVASGAGNIVASGAGNIVASGAGNIVATGGGNIISCNGAGIVASGAGN